MPHTVQTTLAPKRFARVRKAGRGMTEGLVYVEAYLPLDPEAFNEFTQKWVELGNAEAVKAAHPELARKALTPIDTQGEAMLQTDVLELAHSFLTQSRKIDVMHDEATRDSVQIVQSFVNTEEIGSPHFWPGSWVTVLKVAKGSPEFAAIESGELDAVSFQAHVGKVPITADVEAP